MAKVQEHFDHVGSYLRPAALKEAREQFANGEISQDELLKVQDQLVKELVHHEVENGLKVVSDGEFGRSWWHLDFLWNLTGFEAYLQEDSYKFHGAKTRTTNVRLNGQVAENPEHPFYRDFTYLKSITPEGVTPKVTIPSPSLVIDRDHRSDLYADYYEDWTGFLDGLAKAYHDTIQHFYDLGARYVQLDDTTWAFLLHQLETFKDEPEKRAHFEKLAEDDVYVINKALEGLPEDLTLATHICRGNFKSTYLFEGGYQTIAKYLGQLNYDIFFLEYDDSRSGDFSPLSEIWNGRDNVELVLGVITSKDPQLEDVDAVIARIQEAAELVPLKNLGISTQCGFASTEEGNILTEEDEWKKLQLIQNITEKVWG
ncbi:vitamin B12 independent methionine synthase [Streptococcus saliviloxodontae]|uniref:Methionine synthase II (Cobalamin-independent) n=1 Tax=Streptococcus saliviloxodontae TaxID=1349416 RepID=A0ABS2PNH7_9STRE|nr:vitamin B12 independent methionine synthase [Streptococcus saliviloxodontae]MBM7636358.1 methionine synthase II (cobalamin-independent) [Streptococcus saliviloxodontae]